MQQIIAVFEHGSNSLGKKPYPLRDNQYRNKTKRDQYSLSYNDLKDRMPCVFLDFLAALPRLLLLLYNDKRLKRENTLAGNAFG